MPHHFSLDAIFDCLNPQQRAAVEHLNGPLVIIAGAGTGKTRVITRRIAYLVAAQHARPEQILALTFTEKAAAEMESRVDELVPYGEVGFTISTFHAFGDRLVREFAVDLGLDPDFRLLSPAEQALFLREHLFDLPLHHYRPLGNPTKFLLELLRHFSRLKDEDVSPEEYLAFTEKLLAETPVDDPAARRAAEKQQELARCYQVYQKLLLQAGCADFGDQIIYALKLLREHPDIRRRLQERYRYILVDEFQDTNYAQFQLVRELAAAHQNLTVVADDDQSIYKFRGAAISNILNFTQTYPHARHVVLTQNYRSTQAILDTAYRLIRHNDPNRLEVKQQINKKLTGKAPGGQPVVHWHFDTVSNEAAAVAQHIRARVQSGVARPQDFCILVRSNNAADPFLRALQEAGLPHRFSGSYGLYQREEVRLLICFLKSIANPLDSQNLYHLAQSEIYAMPMQDLQAALQVHAATHHPLLHIFKTPEQFEWQQPLSEEGRATAAKLLADNEKYLEMSRQLPAYALLYTFLKESGYLHRLAHSETVAADEKIGNITRFFQTVQNYAYFTTPGDLTFFVNHLELLREYGDDPGTAPADLDADAVQVMTLHKAKGLEFPVVFMVGLVEERFPTRPRTSTIELPEGVIKDILPEGDFHLQEERRLFYVGMTRAQSELYLTSSRDYGGSRLRKVSGFVREALDDAHADDDVIKPSPFEALARFDLPEAAPAAAAGPLPPEQVLHLDQRKIDDYLTCPLKYKYIHVLQVPVAEHHAIIYGRLLHEVVQFYNRRRFRRESVTVEELLALYRAKWRSHGYLSREHERLRFAAGEETVRRFFAQQEADPARPLYVEAPFKFTFANNIISGRWDRIDQLADGRIVITDFKSSAVADAEEARDRARDSRQLRLYAWAYEEQFGRPVDGWRLYFLESGMLGEVSRKELYLRTIREHVQEAAAGIRQRNYRPKPGPGTCPFCALNDICPAAEKN
ncbi:MAG: ATP-dependent helicase [candidate division KSB1 bacterium]|nr:ATP-dependent helicase [candidate division KSB1 bacterium]MDZ7275317.1 ATP-dependent helicase [candidate division KSB1 bacterium]MDZ7287484.1 ATP-dependent helicase [candidate division KSB1 bacterium]MDZ7299598.1 ATP-dependent helicase [candidate division KSB1 bacterium]MDZ7307464.1 ATP-dependent helicase [candidate division KSB1 bacterium]